MAGGGKGRAGAEGGGEEKKEEKRGAEGGAGKKKMPGRGHGEGGINMMPSEAAYDVALYSEFVNEKDLDSYQKHPEHIKIADFINKIRESRIVIDYKTE